MQVTSETTDKLQKRETSEPHATMASVVHDAQDDGRAQKERISKVSKKDREQYDSEVGASVATKLRGTNGKDQDKHQVQGRDGRYYDGTSHASVPELDENGKPTGKTVELDKLSNGELAKLLDKTIHKYDQPGRTDEGSAYEREREHSKVPEEDEAVRSRVAEAAKLARAGQPGGLPPDDIDRLLRVQGDFSNADKRLLMYSGGAAALVAFEKARDTFQQYDRDKRDFNEKMARDGIFFEGKTRLCCCRNARDKAVAMIHRAHTGNPPEGAACMGNHLENVM